MDILKTASMIRLNSPLIQAILLFSGQTMIRIATLLNVLFVIENLSNCSLLLTQIVTIRLIP